MRQHWVISTLSIILLSFPVYGEFGGGFPPPGGGGAGGGNLGAEDLVHLACNKEYDQKIKAERATRAPSETRTLGATQRVFNAGEGEGNSGNQTTSLGGNASGVNGGQVTDLSQLGLGDLSGVIDGGDRGVRGMNGTTTGNGNPGPGVNPMAILAGFEAVGRQVGQEEAKLRREEEAGRGVYVANCIRQFYVENNIDPPGQRSNNGGGGLDSLTLQLLLSSGGGDGEDDGPPDFYSGLPGTNGENGNGDGTGDMPY